MHAKTVLRVFPSSGFGNSERTSSNVSSFFVSTRFSSPLCSSNTRRTVRATSRTFFEGRGQMFYSSTRRGKRAMRVDNARKRAYPTMREPRNRGTRRRGNEKATAQTCPSASKVSRLILKLFSLCFVFGQIKSFFVGTCIKAHFTDRHLSC